MTLKFLGIDPNTGNGGSPTIWRDQETGDLVIQGLRADADTLEQCRQTGSIPGHPTDIPDHEAVIRLPARMIPLLPHT